MPRVDNIGFNVDLWYKHKANGNGSSTFDVCGYCADVLECDPHAFDDELRPYNGDPNGFRGRGGAVSHPPYEDEEDFHRCAVCNDILGEEDN